MDGRTNITIDGNTTLTGLTNGSHTLTIYANDTYGSTAAPQTVTFVIAKPEPFPTATVTAVSVAVATFVVAGLLVYFRKRKY